MHDSNHERSGLSKFLGFVVKRRTPVGDGVHFTAAQVNARPLVGSVPFMDQPVYNGAQGGQGPQLAPEQTVRHGSFANIGRILGARIPKFVSVYDQTAWENQSFAAGHVAYAAGGGIPYGNMLPEWERSNIDVPNSVAYGSQFAYDALPYGYV
jgi:hypothetical protein